MYQGFIFYVTPQKKWARVSRKDTKDSKDVSNGARY